MPESGDERTPEVTEECGSEENGRNDEPPMYMERPSSARSQDVTHILVRTFRELFTRDTIAPDTIQYLNTSRCTENEHHQQYVDDLLKVIIAVYRGFIACVVYFFLQLLYVVDTNHFSPVSEFMSY